jgi:choline monooxygenase
MTYRDGLKSEMKKKLLIDPDIRLAETMPSSFYLEDESFQQSKERIFAKSWHWVGDDDILPHNQNVYPFTIMESFLDESCIVVKDAEGRLSVISNVCTHRGSTILEASGRVQKLVCRYHGRRFKLNGQFEFMPEFQETLSFPRACDDLKRYETIKWNQFILTSLSPDFALQTIFDKMEERIGFLPIDSFRFDFDSSKMHEVHAHWALYCDNYLEGFHIPFVHASLNEVLDYGSYETIVNDEIILQIGYAKNTEDSFELPKGHIDYGKDVAAFYYFIFPNLMLNFYPWGLSINVVNPIRKDYTEVTFLTYIHDDKKFNLGAEDMTDKVEEEDELVVEAVQQGLKSRAYHKGRYSSTREQGVHHFHRLIAERMNGGGEI